MLKKTKTIKTEIMHRMAKISRREDQGDDDRTVTISFSSEEPVDTYYGIEILDHANESVDLTFLNSGRAPVLLDHMRQVQIGVVEASSIDDLRGQATIRFGKSAKADEIFKDVLDGIRTNISVAYSIRKMVLEKEEDDIATYRIIDWRPFEISVVSIPADETVGFGRSKDLETETIIYSNETKRGKQMPKEIEQENENQVVTPPAETGQRNQQATPGTSVGESISEGDILKAERTRVEEITALGKRHKQGDAANKAIRNGATVASFRGYILDKLGDDVEIETPATNLDLTGQETREYSLFKMVRAYATGDMSLAPFELECSREIQKRLGRDPKGFFVPFDIQKRALNVGTPTAGGNIVATNHMAGSFIELLRAKSVIGQLGARMIQGLVGNVDIPKLTGGATFFWLDEDADVTDSQQTIGNVTMTPKTIAGSVPMTRRLLKQSSPDVESMVLDDLLMGAALAIDSATINGTGASGQPEGILAATGVNTETITAAGQPTWADIVAFETAAEEDNALLGNPHYLLRPAVKGHCKTTEKASGTAQFIMGEGKELNGYPAISTNQMPANGILFGDFSSVLVGFWGVLDIMPDVAAKAASGGLVLRVFQDTDVGLRHVESFCKNA